MTDNLTASTFRESFLPRLAEHDTAADLFDQAADALLAGDITRCRELIEAADIPVLCEYAYSVVGPINPKIHRQSRMPGGLLPKEALAGSRMPGTKVIRDLYERDGYRCRYCGTRVILPEARKVFLAWVPEVAYGKHDKHGHVVNPASSPDAAQPKPGKERHCGFSVLQASVDHVLPHRRGGNNEPDNLVTACGVCQFGRSNWLLSEVEIHNPFERPPIIDEWDGLKRVLPLKRKSSPQ